MERLLEIQQRMAEIGFALKLCVIQMKRDVDDPKQRERFIQFVSKAAALMLESNLLMEEAKMIKKEMTLSKRN